MERRSFLKLTGIAGILAAHRAPAFAQGSKLHIVRWVDFIPEADVELKRQAPEASKALGAEVLPMALVRPLSGSGSLGLLGNIFATPGLGPDSYAGRLGSILQGSTETTFYVLSVYCGSVGIVRYRHALAAGLLADFTGLSASVVIARMLWS